MEFTVATTGRLDAILAENIEELSRSQAGKLIKAGRVNVNGKRVTKSALKVKAGDAVSFSMPEIHESPVQERRDIDFDILYEDDSCLVINKPAAAVVTDLEAPGRTLVHRLDKDTTGCLLFAKSTASLAALQSQFKGRTVSKSYLALVAGVPNLPEATIDAPVGRNLVNRVKMSILRTSKSRDAQTTYHTLGATLDIAFLSCDLHTGRTHQIRVHLSSIGHPILGDDTYGNSESKKLSEQYEIDMICLHAQKLTFRSPETAKEVHSEAPLPELFKQVLEKLDLDVG